MISMSQAYSIRQLKKQGETVAGIARKVGVCRNTVYNCLAPVSSQFATPRFASEVMQPLSNGGFSPEGYPV